MLSLYVSDLMLFIFSLCLKQQQQSFDHVLTKMFILYYTTASNISNLK